MKSVKIEVLRPKAALQAFKHAWRQTKRGEVVMPRLAFGSWAQVFSAITEKRVELIRYVIVREQINTRQLAQALRRDYKNVYTDVQTLVQIGLLDKDSRGRISAPYDEILIRAELGVEVDDDSAPTERLGARGSREGSAPASSGASNGYGTVPHGTARYYMVHKTRAAPANFLCDQHLTRPGGSVKLPATGLYNALPGDHVTKLLSLDQAARLIDRAPRTLRYWAAQGYVPRQLSLSDLPHLRALAGSVTTNREGSAEPEAGPVPAVEASGGLDE